jgi:hypothetical protein
MNEDEMQPALGPDGSATFEIPDGASPEITENDDGSVDIALQGEEGEQVDTEGEALDEEMAAEFYRNLAEDIDPSLLAATARTLMERITEDVESRKERDRVYAEGLKRCGLSTGADERGEAFSGEEDDSLVHPVITKAVVDFQSSTVKELFPPSGPAKDKIIGKATQEKVEKARRKAKWLNYQVTEKMREFRPDFEQVLSQVGLAGTAYMKFYWDARLDRPRSEPVYADNIIYPAFASSFAAADRKAHRFTLTAQQVEERVKSGVYVAPMIGMPTPETPERSQTEHEIDRITGADDSPSNLDGLRTIYEVYAYLALENEDSVDPYVVVIDDSTEHVYAVYRNWEPDDDKKLEMQHIVEFPFIPWRGGAVGFVHLIGALSRAASGALNALLDSAHVNNTPTALRLKGIHGQDVEVSPGTITEVDGGASADDIRKLFMPLPFNPPAPVLFQLLGFITQAAETTVQTTMEKLSEARQDAPVGTTLALIEQGLKVFSAIHARLHWAMGDCLRIIHRLNKTYLGTEDVVDATGEVMVRRADFAGPMDVVPVSDPTIFSEAQRVAQIQSIMQRADSKPDIYNAREIEVEFLDRIRMGDMKDRFLAPVPMPEPMNAINENVAAGMGKPVAALPEQDHLAHIITHIEFLKSPVFGMSTLVGQKATPILLGHLREHWVLYYLQRAHARIEEVSQTDPAQLLDPADAELTQAFDMLASQVSSMVVQGAQAELQQFMADIAELEKFAGQFQQQNDPMSLERQKVQIAQQDLQQRGQAAMQTSQARLQEAQARVQEAQARLQEAQRRAQMEEQKLALDSNESAADRASREGVASMQMDVRERMNESDNQVAREIAYAQISTGGGTNLRTGTGINPGP